MVTMARSFRASLYRSISSSIISIRRAEGLCFNNVVSVVPQPLGQPVSGASVYQKPQGPDTDMDARVSPAITV